MGMAIDNFALLHLLQLTSPALPVGAYSYSDGLESLVDRGKIGDRATLYDWLAGELAGGTIRMETAIVLRGYGGFCQQDWGQINYWNAWLSAARETRELRLQNWQMGQSLLRLLADLTPAVTEAIAAIDSPCNYAIAFALASASRHIDPQTATLAYLYSWTANLISAGVRSIPLGQTEGQQIQRQLQPAIVVARDAIAQLTDDDLASCSWGLSLASMAHETQYSRLFRS
jgi:urease accessory protein